MNSELIDKIKELAKKLVAEEDRYNSAIQIIENAEAVQMEALAGRSKLMGEWEKLIRELAEKE